MEKYDADGKLDFLPAQRIHVANALRAREAGEHLHRVDAYAFRMCDFN